MDNYKLLEKGSIYFFYRPRVNHETVDSNEDVQRFYFILKPENADIYRLATVGKKKLPDPDEKGEQRFWGYIDMVRNTPEPLRSELSEKVYNTRSMAERHLPVSRPAGQGLYGLVLYNNNTHFIYRLQTPEQTGDVQKDLNIADEASYIITIKNPAYGSPPGTGLPDDQKAGYPEELMERFRNRRFSEADPPEFLNHEKAEFILISETDEINPDEMNLSQEGSIDLFRDLKIDQNSRPVEPLFKGEWK